MPNKTSTITTPTSLDTDVKARLVKKFLTLNKKKYRLEKDGIEVEIQRISHNQILLRETLMFDNLTFYKLNDSKNFEIYTENQIGHFLQDTLIDVNFDGFKDYLVIEDNSTPNFFYEVYLYVQDSGGFYQLLNPIDENNFRFSNLSIDKKNACLTSFDISNFSDFLTITRFFFIQGEIYQKQKIEVRKIISPKDTIFEQSEYYCKENRTNWIPKYVDKKVVKISPIWNCNKGVIINKSINDARNPFF